MTKIVNGIMEIQKVVKINVDQCYNVKNTLISNLKSVWPETILDFADVLAVFEF